LCCDVNKQKRELPADKQITTFTFFFVLQTREKYFEKKKKIGKNVKKKIKTQPGKRNSASGREKLHHVSANGFTKPDVPLKACIDKRLAQVILSHKSVILKL